MGPTQGFHGQGYSLSIRCTTNAGCPVSAKKKNNLQSFFFHIWKKTICRSLLFLWCIGYVPVHFSHAWVLLPVVQKTSMPPLHHLASGCHGCHRRVLWQGFSLLVGCTTWWVATVTRGRKKQSADGFFFLQMWKQKATCIFFFLWCVAMRLSAETKVEVFFEKNVVKKTAIQKN